MKDKFAILFVILFVTSCASAPVETGYLAGVDDSEVFNQEWGDSPEVSRIKGIARKVTVSAQQIITTLGERLASAQKDVDRLRGELHAAELTVLELQRKLLFWRVWAAVATVGIILYFVWRVKYEVSNRRKPLSGT